MDTEMACICPRAPAQQSCYQRATARSDADALLPTLVEGTFRTRSLFTGLRRFVYTQGDNDVISMPAGFRRHLVGNTLINAFHRHIAVIRLVGFVSDHTDIFINRQIDCYLNNRINLRPLTPHISHVIPTKWRQYRGPDSVTSLHPMYTS